MITSKNIAEFLCVTTRGENAALSIDEALAVIKVFVSNCKVLFPDSTTAELFFELLSRERVTGLLVHDYEIASIALGHEVTKIATANSKDFRKIAGLEAIAPT